MNDTLCPKNGSASAGTNPKPLLCLALALSVGLYGASTVTGHCGDAGPKLRFVKVDSEENDGEDGAGRNAVDGDTGTIWHTRWHGASPKPPHEIIIELDPPSVIRGFSYLPRQDESDHGTIKDYELYVSDDGTNFGKPVKSGTFEPGKEMKTETFEPVKCQFIKLKALSEINGLPWTSAAEIGVIAGDAPAPETDAPRKDQEPGTQPWGGPKPAPPNAVPTPGLVPD